MAESKMKNIAAVDLLEESSGLENVVVETMGELKRLPVSQIKGSGGGAGFDLMGKTGTVVEVAGGGELVEFGDTTLLVSGEPTFEDIFGSGSALNQANVYRTDCGLIEEEGGPVLTTYEIFGFYYNSAWMYAIPAAQMGMEEFSQVATVKSGVILESDATFAELQEIKKTRPITCAIAANTDMIQGYFSQQADFFAFLQSMASKDEKTIQQFVLDEYGLTIGNGELITILCASLAGDWVMGILFLWEDGTEEEPVLGTAWAIFDDD